MNKTDEIIQRHNDLACSTLHVEGALKEWMNHYLNDVIYLIGELNAAKRLYAHIDGQLNEEEAEHIKQEESLKSQLAQAQLLLGTQQKQLSECVATIEAAAKCIKEFVKDSEITEELEKLLDAYSEAETTRILGMTDEQVIACSYANFNKGEG